MTMNSLEEQALQRQQRLKLLKRKATEKADGVDGDGANAKSLPAPKFRSYKPQDKNLGDSKEAKVETNGVTNEVKDLLDLAKSDMVIDQLDISTLAPRRPDWDLKRDVAKKLEKLERRTQKAMAELIRDKLKAKQDLAEIATEPAAQYTN